VGCRTPGAPQPVCPRVIAGITALYVSATELMKKWFYRKDEGRSVPGNRKEA